MPIVWSPDDDDKPYRSSTTAWLRYVPDGPDNDRLSYDHPYGVSASERADLDARREQASAEASEDAQARDWHAALSAPDAPTVLFTPIRLRLLTAWLQQALAVAQGAACGIGPLGLGR